MDEFVADPRRVMTPARKRRIWEAWGGKCWFCRQPVDQVGPGVVYDHVIQLWMAGSDADEDIGPIHAETCNKFKTAADATKRAKTKRLIAKHDPDAEKKPSRLKSRGFEKGPKRKWPKRSFSGKTVVDM